MQDIDRFLLIGPARSIQELTIQLNMLNEGITRIEHIYVEGFWIWRRYYAVLDRAMQMVVTPDTYLPDNTEDFEENGDNVRFYPSFNVDMA